MTNDSFITLLSDFGPDSPYVAALKGVILSINPAARLVDISHSIRPQDIRQAALVLADAAAWFPPDTIHLAVVDPQVGTDRRLIYARFGNQRFLAPDNGLLSRVALIASRSGPASPRQIITLTNPEFWLPNVSATFHGRDILAPLAARLSLGQDPASFGPPQADLVWLDWPVPQVEPRRISGAVLWIDAFGNLITDIHADLLPPADQRAALRVSCRDQVITGLIRTYADCPSGTLVALVGSSGMLELATVHGSAAATLNAAPGDPVTVEWRE